MSEMEPWDMDLAMSYQALFEENDLEKDNMPESKNEEEVESTIKRKEKHFNWTRECTLRLIELVKERFTELQGNQALKRQMWCEIRGILENEGIMISSIELTTEAITKKWQNLVQGYKNFLENGNKDAKVKKRPEFFKQLEEVLRRDTSNRPSYVICCGLPPRKKQRRSGIMDEDPLNTPPSSPSGSHSKQAQTSTGGLPSTDSESDDELSSAAKRHLWTPKNTCHFLKIVKVNYHIVQNKNTNKKLLWAAVTKKMKKRDPKDCENLTPGIVAKKWRSLQNCYKYYVANRNDTTRKKKVRRPEFFDVLEQILEGDQTDETSNSLPKIVVCCGLDTCQNTYNSPNLTPESPIPFTQSPDTESGPDMEENGYEHSAPEDRPKRKRRKSPHPSTMEQTLCQITKQLEAKVKKKEVKLKMLHKDIGTKCQQWEHIIELLSGQSCNTNDKKSNADSKAFELINSVENKVKTLEERFEKGLESLQNKIDCLTGDLQGK